MYIIKNLILVSDKDPAIALLITQSSDERIFMVEINGNER